MLLAIAANLGTVLADGPQPSGPTTNGIPQTWPSPQQFPVVDLPVTYNPPMPLPVDAGDPTQPVWPIEDALSQLPTCSGTECTFDALVQDGLNNTSLGSKPSAVPTIAVATSSPRTTYSRGEAIGFTVTVTNPATQKQAVTSVSNPVPAGFRPMPANAVTMNGQPCTTTTTPACTVSASSGLQVGSWTMGKGESDTFAFAMVASGGDRGCGQAQDVAHVTSSGGTNSGSSIVTTCDGGLGVEPWWTYVTRPIGPLGTASVNAGDGNLVVTQSDSTAIPGQGRLELQPRRVYSSEASGNGAPPNAFGNGWTIDFESWTGTPDGVAGVGGLYVPPAESLAANHPVTVIDDGGGRQVVSLQPLATPINVTGISTSDTSAMATVVPRVLALDTAHFDHLCIDDVAARTPGVHLGMWRYTELTAASASTPCTPAAGTTPAVLGWGAERPDRIRYEFAWDGHKLDAVDGNGNEVRYAYSVAPAKDAVLGMPVQVSELASGRSFAISTSSTQTTIKDPAGRSTVYTFDSSMRLTTVANPDGKSLTYTYGCSSLATQLCSATDPRGAATSFTYAATWSDGTAVLGPPKLATLTDRQGAQMLLSHVHLPDSVTVDLGTRRTRFSGFDPSGSAGEVDGIDMTNSSSPTTLHQTLLTWDTSSGAAACNQPDAAVDHNLCRTFREALDGQATADDTSYVYNPAGQMLVRRQCLASSDSTTPSACAPSTAANVTSRDTTRAYTAQYVEAGAFPTVYRDTVSGGGAVSTPTPTNATRWDAATLYALYDTAASLDARGNAPGLTSSQVAGFTSIVSTDDGLNRNPNIQATANPCGGSGAFNTGDVCATTSPLNGTTQAGGTTQSTYDQYGNLLTLRTPDAVASGSTQQFVYTRFWNTDLDLSGTTSAGGWVRSVTDPYGHVTAYGYDAAGNRVRTWDADATNGIAASSFPGSASAPPSTAYTEVDYGSGSTAFHTPWRYVVSTRDPVGDTTGYTLDANGNQTTVRPPRGNAAGNAGNDIVQTFDSRDMLLTRQMPYEAAHGAGPWSYGYDAAGNQVSVTDPRGVVTVNVYDAVNRHIVTKFTRDSYASTTAPAACSDSSSSDAPIPAGRTLCKRTLSYDGVDDVTASGDANAQVTTMTYDGVHEETSRSTPRNQGSFTTVRTDHVYDLDGNVTSVCLPRAFSDGSATSCASALAQPYREDRAYDDQGHLLTDTTYRSTTADTVSYSYDADGNTTQVQDANGHLQRATFDLLDRPVGTSRQRDASTWVQTTSTYDPAGRLVSQATGSSVTAYAYDAAGRRTDAVDGWDGSSNVTTATASADGGTNVHTRTVYDQDGNVVQTYDPRAFSGSPADSRTFMTTAVFDSDGRLTTRYSPRYDNGTYSDLSSGSSAQSTQCPVNTVGYPAIVGVCVSSVSYDGANHVVESVMPTATGTSAARKVDYTITDDGLVAAMTEPSATGSGTATVATLYDGEGRTVKVTDELGRPTTSTYTSDGLLAQKTAEPNGNTTHITSYTYNADGKTATVTDPMGLRTTYAYYTDDREQTVADNAGDTTQYVYDGAGNTIQVFPPSAFAKVAPNTSGTPVANAYTYDNLLLSTTRPVSADGTSQLRRTAYGYTDFGAKASQNTALVNSGGSVLSDAGTQSFAYYPDRRIQRETGRQGETINHVYDAAGNQTSITAGSSTITASYYLDGLPRSVADTASVSGAAGATTSYGYDGGGNVASRVEGLATGAQYTTTFGYEDAGLPTTMNASWVAGSWSWSYDGAGQVAGETDPNSNTVSYAWNSDGTMAGRTLHPGATGNILSQWQYYYDADYRQTGRDFHGANATNGSATVYMRYTYDNAGRLSTFSHSDVVGNPSSVVTTASWDVDGNRTRWSDGTTPNTTATSYNADDSIATQQSGSNPTLTYGYNAAGSVTNDGCHSNGYDGFDRLTSSYAGSSAQGCPVWYMSATYAYDGLDRQTVVADGPYGAATDVHFDGLSNSVALEQQQTGHPADVVYALSPRDEVLADTFAPSSFSRTEFLAQDGYSSITDVTQNGGGMACDSYTDPFGSPLFNAGSNPCHTGSLNDTVLYRQGQRDAVTGAYALGRRTYDPSKAGFLQPDSYRLDGSDAALTSNPRTANLYTYAGGDPVNFSDPSGHNPCSTEGYDDTGNQGCTPQQNRQWAAGSAPGVTPSSSTPYSSSTHPPSNNHYGGPPADEPAQALAIHQVIQGEFRADAPRRRLLDENSGGAVWLSFVKAQEVCWNQSFPKSLLGWHDECSPMTADGVGSALLKLCGRSNPFCHLGQLVGFLIASNSDGSTSICATNCDVLAQEAKDLAQNRSFDEGFREAMMSLPLIGGAGKLGAAEEVGAATEAGSSALEDASANLLSEAQAGIGKPIIGAGTKSGLTGAERLAEEYGGDPYDWAKMTTRHFDLGDGRSIQVHWYENLDTGQGVEWKTKLSDNWYSQ
jgi:RHS repeat-associated protein